MAYGKLRGRVIGINFPGAGLSCGAGGQGKENRKRFRQDRGGVNCRERIDGGERECSNRRRAFLFLIRADYRGFVVGCAIFQIYSVLDGCDGEIARAKNLVSRWGERLDTLCDTIGNLLLVIGVGFGLRAQRPSSGWIYAVEGIFCALLIAANEMWLHKMKTDEESPQNEISAALYPRHRTMAQRSGLMVLGEKNVWWLVQLTKRDVAILFFLLLAIAGFPQWILHLSALVTAITLSLSAIAMLRSRTRG